MKTSFAPIRLCRLLLLGWAALLFVPAISAGQSMQPSPGVIHGSTGPGTPEKKERARLMSPLPLPDLSGLAWAWADTLLAVHDAKASPEERNRPRVSLLAWPTEAARALRWQPLAVARPAAHGPGSDLESVAHVPGTRQFILAESGANREPIAHLFLATLEGERLHIQSVTAWPVAVENVEATAVARAGEDLLFIYAERSEGRERAELAWAPLNRVALRRGQLRRGQLRLGAFTRASYRAAERAGPGDRLITALDVGPAGCLYAASAHDEGRDDGPFRSAVWQAGRVTAGTAHGIGTSAGPAVHLFERPRRVGTLDGLKAESLAAYEQPGGEGVRLAVGTDDEWFGVRYARFRPCRPARREWLARAAFSIFFEKRR